MNTVVISGRLGKDLELKQSKAGKSFLNLSIATTDGYGDNKKTNWHSCTAFGKTAEIMAKHLSKGDSLTVSGSIDYSKNGEKYYTNILVDKFTFGNNRKQEQSNKVQPIPMPNDDQDILPF